jgi:RHS repeat-associated protein
MRLFRVVCWLVACLAVISLAPSAIAQQDQDFETGLNPYRTYQRGNIDSINLLNHGLNVDIPLISYPQRGGKLHLDFVLHYVNQGNWWDCNLDGSSCSYTSSGPYLANGFYVIQAGVFVGGSDGCQPIGDQYGTYTCSAAAGWSGGSDGPMVPTSASSWESADGTGGHVYGFNWQTYMYGGTFVDGNGTTVSSGGYPIPTPAPIAAPEGGATVFGQEDVNGNQISASWSSGWTDTMGRIIPFPVSTSPSVCPQTPLVPSSAWVWNVPGVNGGTYKLTFCYVSNVPETLNWENQTVNGNLTELQSVVLPNGTAWTFQYTSDGNGDLSQITFPTGGTLSYTWRTEDPICVVHYYENARAVVTRTLNPNDGVSPAATWTYNYIQNIVTDVTDPASNDTVHTFSPVISNTCPYYETKTQYYQGSHTSGTLLKTVGNNYSPMWSGSQYGQLSETTNLWANNQENETTDSYDSALTFYAPYWASGTQLSTVYGHTTSGASYGLLETKKDYDYGAGAPGSLLRTTTTTYEALSNSNYLTNNMLSLPASVAVTGSGPGSTATYAYDQTTPVSSGITTMHSSTPPGGTYRGNPTTVSRYLNTTGANLSTTSTFFDTGTADVVTDPNGNTTTYGYSSTYAGAYLTSVTNALGQPTTMTYDFTTGLLTSTTDANNQTATNTYDEMERLTLAKNPDGGQVAYTFNDNPPSPSVDVNITANSSRVPIAGVEISDGLGRLLHKQLTSDPSGTDYTDYTYDTLGRPHTVSNPYRGSPTNLLTTYNYDALSRKTTTTEPDGSVQQLQYCGSATLAVDEAGIWRRIITDGLGRISEADEPTSSSATKNACAGQGGPVYATTYTHDVNGNITGVVQAGSRQRTFVYDSLSRLTSSTNPESNTEAVSPFTSVATAYTYDSDGNVLSVTGPAPNQQGTTMQTISYCYDKLSRMTQKAYTSQTCPMSAPVVAYSYDSSSCGSSPYTCVNIGERTGMTDAAGSESWAYTLNKTASPEGMNVTDQRTTNSIAKTSSYQFNYDGSVATIQYPSGRLFTYTPGGAGKPLTLTDSTTTYVSSVAYSPDGQLAGRSLNLLFAESVLLNSRLQPCWVFVSTSALPTGTQCTGTNAAGAYLDMKFNYNLGADNGSLASITNDRDTTRSQTFAYDQVNRIATAAGSTYATSPSNCWGEQFGYDTTGNWGNLLSISPISSAYTGCTQESLSVTVSAYNRVAALTYDTAGNVTTIPGTGGGSYTFNAENLIASTAGVTYTFDGDNERVEKSNGKLYWYGVDGTLLDETDLTGSVTNSNFNEYVYFNGKRTARRDSSGDVFYYLNDQIGSTRAIVEVPSGQHSGTLCLDTDYYPFGTQRAPIVSSCTSNYKFTSKEFDAESSLYNSNARFYASFQGRFMSPDPSGFSVADAADPQQLNLYTYARNNPLVFTDPMGLDCVYLANDGSTSDHDNASEGPSGTTLGGSSIDHDSTESECTGPDANGNPNGGIWFNGTISSLNDVAADPNSDWVVAHTSEGVEDYCQGSCSDSAFAAFYNKPTQIVVYSNAPPPVDLSDYGTGVFAAVSQRTYGLNKAVTCVAGVVYPFLPAVDPDDINGLLVDSGKSGAEMASEAAEGAAATIKGASRIGPSRVARIAKLESRAAKAAKLAKVLDAAGKVLAAKEAYKNYKENCK